MHLFAQITTVVFCGISLLLGQSTVDIPIKAVTASTGNDVDDCAIWVHPADPAKSLVIVNDKGPETEPAGLYVYRLDGKLLQKIAVYQPQNPDIRYNVRIGSEIMDVLVCADRERGNPTYNRIRVFRINPDKAEASSGFLTEITADAGIPTGQDEAYGHSLYMRPSDGALFSIVSGYGKYDFSQIRLESDGKGKVQGTIVRRWGKDDITGDLCEGICCDDELGFIYIADENTCVLKYLADPDKKNDALAGAFAQNDGIKSDREGINIYRCTENSGYILVSSQGNNQIKVYDRVTNAFAGTVNPEKMKDCDGLDVTAIPLGPQFPHGMAAFHLGSTAGAEFGFYDWSDIATGLQLATPCNATRPVGPVMTTGGDCSRSTSSPSARGVPILYFVNNRMLLRNVPSVNGIAEIVLFNLQGRQVGAPFYGRVHHGELVSGSLGTLHPGTYMVQCLVDETIFTGELILER